MNKVNNSSPPLTVVTVKFSVLSLRASTSSTDRQTRKRTGSLRVHAGIVASLLAVGVVTIQAASGDTPNDVVLENQKPGTNSWKVDGLDATLLKRTNFIGHGSDDSPADSGALVLPNATSSGLIEGYAAAESVNRGSALNFHVSSKVARFDMRFYRMGWYSGNEATEVTSALNLVGTQRAVPTPDANGMVAANWPSTYSLATGATWTSGMYLAALIPAGTTVPSAYVPFVVRNDASTSAFLYVVGTSTSQAYNAWGGKSLYEYNSPGGRAKKVSYDRPYADGYGSGLFFDGDFYMLKFLEREGYDVSYASSSDIALTPGLMTNHKAFLSSFHDEYWSKSMRDNLETWLGQGKHAAFMGANSMYWQTRLENAPDGRAARTIVCYKDAALDPVQGATTTVQFRQSPANRPENSTLGSMYESDFAYGNSVAWIVRGASHWIYNGTGLTDGATIPKAVGYEWDRTFANGLTPANAVILSASVPQAGALHEATIYQRPSGALVFNAGTIYWPWLLDNNNWGVDARAQQMTRNLLNAMINPAGPPATTLPPTTVATTIPVTGTVVNRWDFEDGTTQGWGPWYGGTVAYSSTGALGGTGVLRVSPVSSTSTTVIGVNGLTPGTAYTLAGYAKRDDLAGLVAAVQIFGAAGQIGVDLSPSFAPSVNGWQRFTLSFTVPAGATLVTIGVNGSPSAYSLDDITISTSGAGPTTTVTGPTTTVTGPTTTASGPTTTVAGGGTQVAGATFDNGTTDNWNAWFGGPVSNTPTGGRTGAGALSAATPNPSAYTVLSGLTVGQQYSFRVYMKNPTLPTYRAGELQFYNGSGGLVGPAVQLAYTADANGWFAGAATATLPAGTVSVLVGVGSDSAFLIDDFAAFSGSVTPTTVTTVAQTTVAPTTVAPTTVATTTVVGPTTSTTRPPTTIATTTTTSPVTTTIAGTTTTLATTTSILQPVQVAGWTFESGGTEQWSAASGSSVRNVKNGFSGSRALRITGTGEVSMNATTVVAGASHLVTLYVEPSSSLLPSGQVRFSNGSASIISFTSVGNGWYKGTSRFTPPAGNSSTVIRLSATLSFKVDDVTVVRG